MWWNNENKEEEQQHSIVDIVHQEPSEEDMKKLAEEWCRTMPDNEPNE